MPSSYSKIEKPTAPEAGPVFLCGGDRLNSRALDQQFVSWLNDRPLMYWPIALDPEVRDYNKCLDELRVKLSFGYSGHIGMWSGTSSGSGPFGNKGEYAAIYIDGGNAYRLLATLRRHRLVKRLRDFVVAGGGVYGDSAGAALLGTNVDTVAGLDENTEQLENTEGANILNRFGIFVHYNAHDEMLVKQWSERHKQSALAIEEKAGIVLYADNLRVVGDESAWVVTGSKSVKLRSQKYGRFRGADQRLNAD